MRTAKVMMDEAFNPLPCHGLGDVVKIGLHAAINHFLHKRLLGTEVAVEAAVSQPGIAHQRCDANAIDAFPTKSGRGGRDHALTSFIFVFLLVSHGRKAELNDDHHIIIQSNLNTKNPMKLFNEKVVLVTGGTSGIGRATAIAFAREGARVVVTGRREVEGAESVSLIKAAGGEGLFIRADVSREEDVEALVSKTVEHFGRLDIAFNNAGIFLTTGPITEATVELIDTSFAVNVRGVALGMKHQISAMLKTGGGVIINNASVLGLRPMPGLAIYNATKYAVIGLTKSAALEFAAQGVRINAVCPAIIETDMTAGMRADEGTNQHMQSVHPLGRFGKPEEVAAAVLYLASPGAAFTTGIALPVDGGVGI